MDVGAVRDVLAAQDGVIARRQVLAAGGGDHDIERLVCGRHWARAFDGVYVAHTGPLTWRQRAWAAVLVHGPAALAGEAALATASAGRLGWREPRIVEVVVARHRRVVDPPGVRSTRIRDFDAQVLANLGPPRVRLEHAALTVASRAPGADGVVAVLGDACQTGGTTPDRLLAHLDSRRRLAHRRLIAEVLADVAAGANSALERRYLRDVERAHGLPRGARQHRVVAGAVTAYRDVDYVEFTTVVELDGLLGHGATADRWADLDRDVTTAVGGSVTLRAGWRQVLEPCRLAVAVGLVLAAGGWSGTPRPCAERCSSGYWYGVVRARSSARLGSNGLA